jgi:hypothetical protein
MVLGIMGWNELMTTQVTEEQLAGAAIEFPYNSPATKGLF